MSPMERPAGYEVAVSIIPHKVLSLAENGEDDNGLLAARYKSNDLTVESILVRLIDRNIAKCSVVIIYRDDTHYHISWDEGEVWSLDHSARKEVWDNPDYELPFTDGQKRATYQSHRNIGVVGEAKQTLNVRNLFDSLAAAHPTVRFPQGDEIEDFWDGVRERMEELENSPLGEVLRKGSVDIDPADIDLVTLCAPVMAVDPIADRIPLR